jgi:hypothetical protein
MTAVPSSRPADRFWRSFALLFAGGVAGVLAALPVLAPLVAQQVAKAPTPPPLPTPALVGLSLLQPTLLLAGAVAVGAVLAPRLGLRSHVVEQTTVGAPLLPALRADLPLAAALGAGLGVVLVALDLAMRPWMPPAFLAAAAAQPRGLAITVAGIFYGGITEELLLRWGLLSALAWAGWRMLQGGQGRPSAGLVWSAIGIAALLFGAGHLGAAALMAPLTPALVVRTVLLNSLGGLVFGWLYWRRSLEAGMLAHAATHIAMTLLSLLLG